MVFIRVKIFNSFLNLLDTFVIDERGFPCVALDVMETFYKSDQPQI